MRRGLCCPWLGLEAPYKSDRIPDFSFAPRTTGGSRAANLSLGACSVEFLIARPGFQKAAPSGIPLGGSLGRRALSLGCCHVSRLPAIFLGLGSLERYRGRYQQNRHGIRLPVTQITLFKLESRSMFYRDSQEASLSIRIPPALPSAGQVGSEALLETACFLVIPHPPTDRVLGPPVWGIPSWNPEPRVSCAQMLS